jgi:hypothetical protein
VQQQPAGARQLLILADTGDSNSCRRHAWKTELQAQLSNPFERDLTGPSATQRPLCQACYRKFPSEEKIRSPLSFLCILAPGWVNPKLRNGSFALVSKGSDFGLRQTQSKEVHCLRHNRETDKAGIAWSMPDALCRLLVIRGLCIKDVWHKRLRVAVVEREQARLHLDHDAMSW